MTFNVRYGTANDGTNRWEKRRELVVGVLRRHAPDIVGVQEALKFQLDAILKALPAYKLVGVGRDDGKEKGEYSPILYRGDRFRIAEHGTFWFSDTPGVPGSKSWGNSIPRICTWARFIEKSTGKGFYVYNVHLDHISQPSRVQSTRLLARRIAGRRHEDAPVVTGDFNAGEDNPAILHLKDSRKGPGLVDTFRVVHRDAKQVGTFNGFAGKTSGAKIDFIFVPPWVDVKSAAILHDNDNGRYPSDHFPISAEVRLPVVRKT